MSYRELSEVYRPVFAEIGAGALQRELDRELPHSAVDLLKRSGFTGVRVPVEFGGGGASLPDTFRLLVDLAAADPHVPQALRGHLAFVELAPVTSNTRLETSSDNSVATTLSRATASSMSARSSAVVSWPRATAVS